MNLILKDKTRETNINFDEFLYKDFCNQLESFFTPYDLKIQIGNTIMRVYDSKNIIIHFSLMSMAYTMLAKLKINTSRLLELNIEGKIITTNKEKEYDLIQLLPVLGLSDVSIDIDGWEIKTNKFNNLNTVLDISAVLSVPDCL